MSIYKRENCPICLYSKNVSKPKKINMSCKKCGTRMKYSENYYSDFRVNGKKVRGPHGPIKKEVGIALAEMMKKYILNGSIIDKPKNILWDEAVEYFLKWAEANRPKSYEFYSYCIKALNKRFNKNLSLMKINSGNLEDYKISRGKEVSGSTVKRELATLKRMFKICYSKKWITKEKLEDIRSVEMPKDNPARKEYLTLDEVKKLLIEINQSKSKFLKLAFAISIDTALRRKNVLELKWEEIYFDLNMIIVDAKGEKEIRIPLTSRLRDMLLERREWVKFKDSVYVLTNDPTPPKDLRGSLKTALRRAGINKRITFHSIRKSFSTLFASLVKDPDALQGITGHSSYDTTREHYAFLADDHLSNSINKFEEETKDWFGGGDKLLPDGISGNLN